MRKFSQSKSAWEVGTAVSSLESGYHSHVRGESQVEEVGDPLGWPGGCQTEAQFQRWSDHLYTSQEEEEEGEIGDTKLDLLDSLILEDVKERLQEVTVPGSSRTGPQSVVRVRGLEYASQLYLDTFIQHSIPLAFPGQVQSVSLLLCVAVLTSE